MNLLKLRKKIDKLDSELIKTLKKRVDLLPLIAEYKMSNRLPARHTAREREVLRKASALAIKLDLNPSLVKDIMVRVMKDSRRLEKKIISHKL
jgi:chorismate mutase